MSRWSMDSLAIFLCIAAVLSKELIIEKITLQILSLSIKFKWNRLQVSIRESSGTTKKMRGYGRLSQSMEQGGAKWPRKWLIAPPHSAASVGRKWNLNQYSMIFISGKT